MSDYNASSESGQGESSATNPVFKGHFQPCPNDGSPVGYRIGLPEGHPERTICWKGCVL